MGFHDKINNAVRRYKWDDFTFAGHGLYEIVVTNELQFDWRGINFAYVRGSAHPASDFRWVTGIDPNYAEICKETKDAIMDFVERKADLFEDEEGRSFQSYLNSL